VHYFRLCKACLREVEWTGVGEKLVAERFKVV